MVAEVQGLCAEPSIWFLQAAHLDEALGNSPSLGLTAGNPRPGLQVQLGGGRPALAEQPGKGRATPQGPSQAWLTGRRWAWQGKCLASEAPHLRCSLEPCSPPIGTRRAVSDPALLRYGNEQRLSPGREVDTETV